MSRFGGNLVLISALAACVPGGESRLKDADVVVADAGGEVADVGPADSGEPAPDAGAVDQGVFDSGTPPPPDGDGDGIPDAEDPAPMRANFSLFHDIFDGAVQEWVFSSVSMEIDELSGVLRVDVLEPFVREGWIGPRPAWSDLFARSTLRLTRVGTSDDGASGRAGLMFRVNQVSPDRYLLCAIDLKRGLVVLSEHNGGGPAGTELDSEAITAQLGEWVTMRLRVAGDAATCTVGNVVVQGSSSAGSALTGSIGFRAYDATFEADFLDVYDL